MTNSLANNIASLRGIRLLNKSGNELNVAFTRLSSGLRINSAKDDAAGLALAEKLSAKALQYSQGVRNLSDGESLLAIADSSVSSLTTIVSRLEELATQAANGTLSSEQREALNTEAQSLAEEFDRIRTSTEFNEKALFDVFKHYHFRLVLMQ